MFPSGVDSGHVVADGIGGTVLVPTRFVWPYGGRAVILTGSFTRWTEHIPMTPVEGCPTVFQAVCNLTPGYHEYKFYVDGEWRHDERQPFVMVANYGTVNTVVLATEPDPGLRPDTSTHRVNMDVDNDASPRVGPSLRISEAEVEASRRRIAAFLSMKTAYDLLPESGKVIALDVDLPVKQAFHILYEQGSSVAPLWDSTRGQIVGILSALDFILILRELGNHGSNLTEEELETHTISAWKEGKPQMKLDGHGRPLPRCLIYAGPHDALKDIALKILQNDVATVPIIHCSSEYGSSHQLLHLACLSEILKCICEHFEHSSSLLPILQQPIYAFPMGTWVPKIGESNRRPLAMLKQHASLSAALSLLVQARVSSIPVVDENDSLVDIYSRSDITALAKDRAYAQIHLDQMSIHQALQLVQEAGSPSFNGQRCQMCLRTDTLLKVMDRLSKPGVRRVMIVEAGSKRVEGIISLSDVFKFLLS